MNNEQLYTTIGTCIIVNIKFATLDKYLQFSSKGVTRLSSSLKANYGKKCLNTYNEVKKII